jgi:hypothetical protein
MVGRALAWGALAVACSSNKARPVVDDAVTPRSPGDGAMGDAAGAIDAVPARGELAVRVEWTDVPAAVRSSPGVTPCHTPRAPLVTPTTTWGVPQAIVLVEGGATPEVARVALADCALAPRAAVGASLVIESRMFEPTRLALAKWGTTADLAALAAPASATPIQLPIAGHAVTAPLDADGVYQLATTATEPEVAWIVAAPAVVTDASGQAMFADLGPGSHRVTAWLPPRAGQPGRLARGEAKVIADQRTELVIELARP